MTVAVDTDTNNHAAVIIGGKGIGRIAHDRAFQLFRHTVNPGEGKNRHAIKAQTHNNATVGTHLGEKITGDGRSHIDERRRRVLGRCRIGTSDRRGHRHNRRAGQEGPRKKPQSR